MLESILTTQSFQAQLPVREICSDTASNATIVGVGAEHA
jgi:hypothetical protein